MKKIILLLLTFTLTTSLIISNKTKAYATITDLTNYQWYADSDTYWFLDSYSINFTANNINYTSIQFSSEGSYQTIYYGSNQVYHRDYGGWLDHSDRTILITGGSDVNNASLIEYLQDNGTLTYIAPPVTDLSNYQWVAMPSFSFSMTDNIVTTTYNINFSSNNVNYTSLTIDRYKSSEYMINYNGTTIFDSDMGGFVYGEAYKTINITGGTDATNTTLISILQNKGTLTYVAPTNPDLTSYNTNFQVNLNDDKPIDFFLSELIADSINIYDFYTLDSNSYTPNQNAVGNFSIVFKRISDNELFTINIQVKDTIKPTITGDFSTITHHKYAHIDYQSFYESIFRNSLTISDNYDTLNKETHLTLISNNYVNNVPGTYQIVYEVKDNSNNKQTYTKTIIVEDFILPDLSSYDTVWEVLLNDNITYIDYFLGNIIADDINIFDYYNLESNLYILNQDKVGTFPITFKNRYDDSVFIIYVKVLDEVAPTITGDFTTFTHHKYAHIDYVFFYESVFRNSLVLLDNYDTLNKETHLTLISNNYVNNVPGTYQIVYEVKDNSNNRQTYTKTIIVEDFILPDLSGYDTNYQVLLNDNITYLEYFIGDLEQDDINIYDFYNLESNLYIVNQDKVGTYPITFKNRYNDSLFIIYVEVIDDIKPTITGNFETLDLTTITTFDIDAFIASLVISDNYDILSKETHLSIKSNNYLANVPGTYEIVLEVIDNSNNKETYSKIINVTEAIYPTIIGNFESIVTNTTTPFKVGEFLNSLTIINNDLGLTIEDNLTIFENNYVPDVPGTYAITFKFTDFNNYHVFYTKEIVVIAAETPPVVNPPTPTPEDENPINLTPEALVFVAIVILIILAIPVKNKNKWRY